MKIKSKIITLAIGSSVFALLTISFGFIAFAHISENKNLIQILSDNDGRSSFLQLILSTTILIVCPFVFFQKKLAIKTLSFLLILTFINILVSIVLSGRLDFTDIINPILWIPLILFLLSKIIMKYKSNK